MVGKSMSPETFRQTGRKLIKSLRVVWPLRVNYLGREGFLFAEALVIPNAREVGRDWGRRRNMFFDKKIYNHSRVYSAELFWRDACQRNIVSFHRNCEHTTKEHSSLCIPPQQNRQWHEKALLLWVRSYTLNVVWKRDVSPLMFLYEAKDLSF